MPPLKGNAILTSSVLFSCKRQISVQVVAKYSLSVDFCLELQTSLVKCFFAIYNRRVQRALFFKKTKKQSYEKSKSTILEAQGRRLLEKKTKNSAESRRKGKEGEPKGGGPTS